MPWDSTNKIMTSPLNLNYNGDIQSATKMGGHTDLGDCIVNGHINMWAKYKPVKSTILTKLTENSLKAVNYGISIDVCGPNGNISSYLENFNEHWRYDRVPSSGGYIYRFYDFLNPTNPSSNVGYRGDANCFIDTDNCNFRTLYQVNISEGGCTFELGMNYPQSNNLKPGSINPADLDLGNVVQSIEDFSLSSMYFGLIFKNGNSHQMITSENRLSEYPINTGENPSVYPFVKLNESSGRLGELTNGVNYTVYPVLSYIKHSLMSNLSSNDIVIAAPTLTSFPFKVVESSMVERMVVRFRGCGMEAAEEELQSNNFVVAVYMKFDGQAGAIHSDIVYQYFSVSYDGDESERDTVGTIYEAYFNTSPRTAEDTSNTTFEVGRFGYQAYKKFRRPAGNGWIMVKAYRSGDSSLYARAWAEIKDDDPRYDVPVD